jgi:hypothetical protein
VICAHESALWRFKSGHMAATGSIGIHRLRVNKPLVL